MQYITSRNFRLPNTKEDMENGAWFNLWKKRIWPYREAISGDTLFWYESRTRMIVWKTQLKDVCRFFYSDKTRLTQRLVEFFGRFDPNQRYFVDASSQGYCLAYKITAEEKLYLEKPQRIAFPYEGWMRCTDNVAIEWLSLADATEEVVLDESLTNTTEVTAENVGRCLRELNKKMADVSPERVSRVVSQTLRRDSRLVRALKQACGFRCQFPGCGTRIRCKNGEFYVEVAHIQPVSKGGKSVLGNLVVLCPNHHKAFDYGDLEVSSQSPESVCGKINGNEFRIEFSSPAE